MGKNLVKEYDEKNNFAIFANTMNKNNQVNMPKGDVLSGGTLIKGNSGGVTNLDGGGAPNTPAATLPEKGNSGAVAETVVTTPVGTETVATAPAGTETVTESPDATGGTVSGDAGGTVSEATGGTTIATAPQIEYIAQATTPRQTFEEWMSAGGYDPDGDFAKAKSDLEYNYMQNMSRFGENAERLAQMGLSGSGVSDIYQLGAYNSYLQSQNDLAARRIEQMREYRNQYSQYEQGWQSGYDTDVATAHNLGLQYYDGTNGEYVSQILKNQGFSQDVINKTLTTLGTYDVNALPTIKQRAADEAAKTEAFNNAVSEGYAFVLDSGMYNGSNVSEVEQRLKNLNYTPEQAAEIVRRLEADESLSTDIKNEVVNEYYAAYAQDYTPETEARIRAELSGTRGEAYVDDIIAKLEANYNATPEDQRPGYVDIKQVMALGRSALVEDDKLIDYNGSAEHKKAIKYALEAAGYGEYVDQILEDFDNELTAGLTANSDGSYDVEKVSLEGILNQYNNGGQITKDKLKRETEKVIEYTLDDMNGLMNAYNLVGMDRASWDQMSDWDKLRTVVDKIGYYSKTGLVDKKYFIQKAVELINKNFEDDDEAIVAYAYETGYSGNGGSDGNVTIKVDDDYLNKYKDKYKSVYDDSRSDKGVVSEIKMLIDDWVKAGYIDNPYEIKGLEVYRHVGSGGNVQPNRSAEITNDNSMKVTINGNTKELPGETITNEETIEFVKKQATGDGDVKFAYLEGVNNKGLYAFDSKTGTVLKVDKDNVALISQGKAPYIPAKGYYGK